MGLSSIKFTVELADLQTLVVTKGENVLVFKVDNESLDTSLISPCSHEEADTRLLLHIFHATSNGYPKACIRTVDSDVVVIACSKFQAIGAEELWVAFGH